MSNVKHEKVSHIVTQQAAAEAQFLAEFAAGDYTLQNPLIKLNPYIFAPLTAMVLFKTPVPAEVTVTVKGKEPAGDISHTFPVATEHILPVYGLYAGRDNTVELLLSNGQRSAITITTEPLPAEVPLATSIKTTAEYFGKNIMFLTAAVRSVPVGFDYRGDLRWYSTHNFAFDLKRLPNGHILVGTERLMGAPYYTTGIYEMAMSGKVFKEYRLPGGYHHDQFPLADGNILILTEDLNSETVEDMCVLVDKDTGEILKTWDYKNVMPQFPVGGSGSQDAHDWFHNNAVWYDKATNSLSFSGRHQDVVINIDFDSGKLNWIIGDPTGWPEEMQKYFFKPVGDLDKFDWQYEQHACMIVPGGDVMLFDNGHYRSKIKENYIKNRDNFSRGVRYRIDTDKMEIEQIWQYGKERGAEFYSQYICNVEYYEEGHYLVHSGGINYENGETCEQMAVLMAMGPDKDKYSFNSITCELLNDELVYELQVPANCYRAEKLPLYYAGEVAELGQGQLLGTLGVTPEMRGKVAESSGEMVPASYNLIITEEEDRLIVNGDFTEGEYASVVLIGENGDTHQYQINTVPRQFLAMCVGTFQKSSATNFDKYISKEGLFGQYDVKLLSEGKVYDTAVTISVA